MNAKIATTLGLGILAASSARAAVLFSQPNDYTDANAEAWLSTTAQASTAYNGYISQPATAFDDFTLPGGGTVTKVDWTGLYPGLEGADVTGFTLDFWSDNAGTPGSLLANYNISGSAGQKFAGTQIYGFSQFDYSVALSSPFSAAAGTPYFLSIVQDATTTTWYWDTSDFGDNGAYEIYGTAGSTGANLAFTLEGAPDGGATAPLLGLALTALGYARRKLCQPC